MSRGEFRSHCDEPVCDLGTFEYNCPVCNYPVTDYDVWNRLMNTGDVAGMTIKCEKCQAPLVISETQDEGWAVEMLPQEEQCAIGNALFNIPDAVHQGPNAEMFTATLVLVPGQKPITVITPRFTKNLKDGADKGVTEDQNVEGLIQSAIIGSAKELAQGVRNALKMPRSTHASKAV